MGWAAHTNSWTLETGTSIWLVADTRSSRPPNGVDLPILLVDGAIIKGRILSSSPSEIVIELFGYCRRMTPAVLRSHGMTNEFPGTEWILRELVKR